MNFDPMTFNMMLNMMNLMYPNMGYNTNNYNMYNNQFLMNFMMTWMRMNPNLFQMYQNMNQNNNMNQNYNMNQNNNMDNNLSQSFNNNNRNKMSLINVSNEELNQAKVTGGGILPKNMPNNKTYDISPNDNSLKTNIAFKTQKGQTINIVCPYSMKIKDLLVKYVTRLGLGPNVMGDSLFFLFNGSKLNKNDDKTVGDLGLVAGSNIVVLDLKGVIGS